MRETERNYNEQTCTYICAHKGRSCGSWREKIDGWWAAALAGPSLDPRNTTREQISSRKEKRKISRFGNKWASRVFGPLYLLTDTDTFIYVRMGGFLKKITFFVSARNYEKLDLGEIISELHFSLDFWVNFMQKWNLLGEWANKWRNNQLWFVFSQ